MALPTSAVLPTMLLAVLVSGVAIAAETDNGHKKGSKSATRAVPQSCPDASMVTEALEGFGSSTVASTSDLPETRVTDLGDSYRVEVAGVARQYADPDRDCRKRAQVAALFVTLMQRDTTPGAKSPTQQDTRSLRIEVAFGGALQLAKDSSELHRTLGPFVRGAIGNRRLAGVAGVSAFLPVESRYGPVSVQQTRFPFELGLRLRWQHRALETSVDAGVVVDVSRFRNLNPEAARSRTQATVGGRSVALLSFSFGSIVAATAGLQTEYYPWPFSLNADLVGNVGQTAQWRLDALTGLVVTFL